MRTIHKYELDITDVQTIDLPEYAEMLTVQEQKDKLIDDIRFEVKGSRIGVKDAIEKLGVARDALAQAEENVRFYRVKYNNGVATSTDVLEAISLQTKAQTNYYSADYELKRSYARLMYSMGNDMAAIYKKTEK